MSKKTDLYNSEFEALADVALSGSYNDLSDQPSGLTNAGFGKEIYVDTRGDDDTGDGTLNQPYATVAKALEVVPDLTDPDNAVVIKVGPGRYTTTSMDLKPFVTIVGSGKKLTHIQIAPSNTLGIDLSDDRFEQSGEIKIGVSDLHLTASGRFSIDASSIANSGGNILFRAIGCHFESQCEFFGRPNGADRIELYDCDSPSDNIIRTAQGSCSGSVLGSLQLQCQSYSGGGESTFTLRNSPVVAGLVITSVDATRDQVVEAVSSPISSINIDGNNTNPRVEADAISCPADDDISIVNGGEIVRTTVIESIDGLRAELDDKVGTDAIDGKADALGTASRIAWYNRDTGLLESASQVFINEYDGLQSNGGLSYDGDAENDSTYAIHNFDHFISAPEANVSNIFINHGQSRLHFDSNNDGFDWGTNNGVGGFGLRGDYFGHHGSGNISRLDLDNLFIELGGNNVGGTTNFVAASTISVNVREDHEVTDYLRVSFLGTDFNGSIGKGVTLSEANTQLQNESSIESFQGYSTNLAVSGASEITSYVIGSNVNLNINDSAQIGNITGIQVGLNLDGVGTNVNSSTGINVNYTGSATFTSGPTGVSVNMGNFDSAVQRRIAFSGNNGALFNSQEVSTSPNLFFDQGNVLNNNFVVKNGVPITSTSFISNNFATNFIMLDDIDAGILGLGVTGVGFVGQLMVADTKTAALINFAVGGASIPDFEGLGGTLEKANVFCALGIVNQGGPNDVVVEEVRAFTMPPGGLGLAKWGIDIEDDTAENHLAKSLVIGASNVVTNSDIALEIADKKAFKLTPMTIAERDALVAVMGMVVSIDDGATQELNYYNGTSWISL